MTYKDGQLFVRRMNLVLNGLIRNGCGHDRGGRGQIQFRSVLLGSLGVGERDDDGKDLRVMIHDDVELSDVVGTSAASLTGSALTLRYFMWLHPDAVEYGIDLAGMRCDADGNLHEDFAVVYNLEYLSHCCSLYGGY